ncbi:hypothetical protein LTR74_017919 [Friedmanniomyces endolithicus]|nr:hypothetical protein LTR74_017919 [Friedmanniomyces endolithicus]
MLGRDAVYDRRASFPYDASGRSKAAGHSTSRHASDDERFLLQMPVKIQGFRMFDKSWRTDAVEVEKHGQYLESVFYLGRQWKCVVLMDEADVFLEQRTIDDMQRNALVSTFLRLIEFYDGILILTTKRVGTFDEAFKSRIQLALRYHPLNNSQRKKIWTNFLNRLSSVEEQMELPQIQARLDELARIPINGREIRNTLNTARQLARFQGIPLNYSHLQKVLGVSREFEDYIKEVKGVDDEVFKRELGER